MDRLEKIAKIAKHYSCTDPVSNAYKMLDLIMDIECVDKVHNLDLDRMLNDLDSFNVAHDVFGIWKHLDRKTKKLTGHWTPRFGRDWEETQDAQHWEHDKSLIQDDNGKVIGKRRGLHNWRD